MRFNINDNAYQNATRQKTWKPIETRYAEL